MKWKPYPRYKDSGVEWLGEVPDGWGTKALKRVASFNDDVLPESTDPNTDIEYVDISSVSGERGIEKAELMRFDSAPSRARRRVRDGDVLISTVRTYLKAIAPIARPPHNLIVSTGFAVVRPQSGFEPAFSRYALQAHHFMDEVVARSVGVSYPAINPSDLVRIKIPLPGVAEQRTIAIFLDRETTKLDTLIAKQERLIELLQEKRQALISHAVTKGLNPDAPMKDSGVEWLGAVPAHWAVVRLGSLFREVAEEGSKDLPVLRVSIHDGVSDREFDDEELERKVTRSEDRSKYKRVQIGDLVYNMMRAWQGGFGTVAVSGMVSPAYVVARPKAELETEFIEGVLRTPLAVEELRRHSHGVTDFRLRLYWDEFKSIKVAVPPLHEQKAIMAVARAEAAKVNNLVDKSRRSIDLMREHRSALISAAVTGKIDVREAPMSEADLEKLFDEIVAEVAAEHRLPPEQRKPSIIDEVNKSLDEKGRTELRRAIDELGKIFGVRIKE